jgi:hypothetical protein
MNVLILYNSSQTYTSTVYEHLTSFYKYSENNIFFANHEPTKQLVIDLSAFDAIVIHYTIRLPFDQVSDANANLLSNYSGLKILFIQDEYDYTQNAWRWIKRLGIKLVFTVVPEASVEQVYPPEQFPGVQFVSVLTGYVPDNLNIECKPTASKRALTIGYRGRHLPIRYGELAREKILVGSIVKNYCISNDIRHDIEWTEEARIYGDKWYEFMTSCRAMLGSESGSNVFDWDGTLEFKIEQFKKNNHQVTENEIYNEIIKPIEIHGLMNQVSPRVFEAIASYTVLVLFEGAYSNVVTPGVHFIPLKKDRSNLSEVFDLLADDNYVDKMTKRAHEDVISSGQYSYETFVAKIDEELNSHFKSLSHDPSNDNSNDNNNDNKACFSDSPSNLTTRPITLITLSEVETFHILMTKVLNFQERLFLFLWPKLPKLLRDNLKSLIKRIIKA